MKTLFLTLLLLISAPSFAQSGEFLNCPPSEDLWHDPKGGINNNGAWRHVEGRFESIEALWALKLPATEAANPHLKFYVRPPQIGHRFYISEWDVHRDGVFFEHWQYAHSKERFCPAGYIAGESVQLGAEGRCVNATTRTCQCPSGTKFKPAANQCVAYDPAEDEANKDKDNGDLCDEQPKCGNPIKPGSGNKVQVEVDYAAAEGMLKFKRTYNSEPNTIDMRPSFTGAHWSNNFELRMKHRPETVDVRCYRWRDDGTKFCAEQHNGDETMTVSRPDGRRAIFRKSGANFVGDPTTNETLTILPSGLYAFRDVDGTVEEYELNGVLTSIAYPNGSVIRLTWSLANNDSAQLRMPANAPICSNVQAGPTIYGIHILCATDQAGRQLNFEYDEKQRIVKMIDPAGSAYIYTYDGPSGGCEATTANSKACSLSNLTGVTYPDAATKIYHYNELANTNNGQPCVGLAATGATLGPLPHGLTGITDENGVRFATWTYDCQGRGTSSQHAGGAERVDLAYSGIDTAGNSTTWVTDYSGDLSAPVPTTRVYKFKLNNGKPLIENIDRPCLGCGNIANATYDVQGNWATRVDWNGNQTKFTYDPGSNLEVSRTEAFGTASARTISTQWNTAIRKPLKIAEPKRIISYTYDTKGNVLTEKVETSTDLTGAAGFSATLLPGPQTTTYTYNSDGKLQTITSPRTDVVARILYDYDSFGNLSKVTNASGHPTTYTNYDAHGRVGRITSPTGAVTDLAYSIRGWLKTKTITAGGTVLNTSYEYDNIGQLKKITQPDNSFIVLEYDDARRLTSIADALGNSVRYARDVSGNIVGEQSKDNTGILARSISRIFDNMGRVNTVVGAAR